MSSRCFTRSDLISVKNHFTSSRSSYNRCNTAPWRASELQCAEAAVRALTPSPGRGPPNKREFSGRDLMRFIIFTDWFSTESKRTGIFLAASASRWIMHVSISQVELLAEREQLGHAHAPVIACAPSVHRPTHRSQAKPFSRIKYQGHWKWLLL